jgi:hypothetical protein
MRRMAGIAASIALAVIIAAALMLAGCTKSSAADEQKAKCFANEALIGAEMKLFKADSGLDAPLKDVVSKLHAACPSGGTYSYDANTGIVSCSIHGHS